MEPQRVELWGGWSLVLPSPCRTGRNEDGSWSAWDDTHVVDLSIIEVGGREGGGSMAPEEMLAGTETRERHDLDGAIARISTDVEITDTDNGPQPIEWTRVQAGAENTALIMSIGNSGARDTDWHERLWRSVQHTPPKKGIRARLWQR